MIRQAAFPTLNFFGKERFPDADSPDYFVMDNRWLKFLHKFRNDNVSHHRLHFVWYTRHRDKDFPVFLEPHSRSSSVYIGDFFTADRQGSLLPIHFRKFPASASEEFSYLSQCFLMDLKFTTKVFRQTRFREIITGRTKSTGNQNDVSACFRFSERG